MIPDGYTDALADIEIYEMEACVNSLRCLTSRRLLGTFDS